MKKEILYWVIIPILAIGSFIGLLILMYWIMPSSTSRTYDWGKQVCVEIKPSRSWVSRITCFDN